MTVSPEEVRFFVINVRNVMKRLKYSMDTDEVGIVLNILL